MFPPASSNRSKNSRSLGARTLESLMPGRSYQSPRLRLARVEARGLDAAGRRPPAPPRLPPHRGGAAHVVVGDPPVANLAARLEQAVGRARVAVEGHPH